MKRRVMTLNILLGILLLAVCTSSQASSWKLEEKLNPKKTWCVTVSDKDIMLFSRQYLKKINLSRKSAVSFQQIASAKVGEFSPVIVFFSPDQISLDEIEKRHHYLFIIPIDRIKEILAEGKCVIVSGKVKIRMARAVYNSSESEWVVVSDAEAEGEESSITLVAAPSKEALKVAIDQLFSKLEKVPWEPFIFEVEKETGEEKRKRREENE